MEEKFENANSNELVETVKGVVNEAIAENFKKLEQLAVLQAKEVLNTEEAAVFTGFSKPYLYKLVSWKSVPFYKGTGGKYTYFKKSELVDWMLRHRRQTIEEIESAAAEYVAKHPVRKGGAA